MTPDGFIRFLFFEYDQGAEPQIPISTSSLLTSSRRQREMIVLVS